MVGNKRVGRVGDAFLCVGKCRSRWSPQGSVMWVVGRSQRLQIAAAAVAVSVGELCVRVSAAPAKVPVSVSAQLVPLQSVS